MSRSDLKEEVDPKPARSSKDAQACLLERTKARSLLELALAVKLRSYDQLPA